MRITVDPCVMGGKPCIRGMRVTVGTLVGLTAAGYSTVEILELYPYLEAEDLEEALTYADASDPPLSGDALVEAAVRLIEQGRLSSGAAASLAGLPRTVLLSKLAEYGVDTFSLSEDELRRDMENTSAFLRPEGPAEVSPGWSPRAGGERTEPWVRTSKTPGPEGPEE